MEAFHHFERVWLGLGVEPRDLTLSQIALRAVIVFIATLIIVRLGEKRFLSGKTTMDAVLGFMLASMLARAINGSSAFWATLGGGFVLVCLHRFLAFASRRSHSFGNLVKGHANLIIDDGVVNEREMARHNISSHDLGEDLRLHGNVAKPADVQAAYLERNGQISVVPKKA